MHPRERSHFHSPSSFRLYFYQLIHATKQAHWTICRIVFVWEGKSRQRAPPSVIDSRDNTLSSSTEPKHNVDNVTVSIVQFNAISQTYPCLFSSTIKNVCLERREVISIGLRGMCQAISRITDKQESRYIGKIVEIPIYMFLHCTRD